MIVNDDDDLFDYTFSKKDSVSFIISLYLQESKFKNREKNNKIYFLILVVDI